MDETVYVSKLWYKVMTFTIEYNRQATLNGSMAFNAEWHQQRIWVDNATDYRPLWSVCKFKPLSYCFKETIGFDVKGSFASRPESRLISWYNEPGDITKKCWYKAIQFHGTFHGLKIINCDGKLLL